MTKDILLLIGTGVTLVIWLYIKDLIIDQHFNEQQRKN